VELVANVLQLDPEQLNDSLIRRTIVTPTERTRVNLDREKAEYARDAISKAVYSRLFDLIVRICNDNIKGQVQRVIGILDIYGFEIFVQNSFEQLCINYCNEKLQQLFIELTLKSEQEEYVREGIRWTPVEYFNNAIICSLIEEKPFGVIAFLDECSLLDAPDRAFLEKLDRNFAKHNHYASAETDKQLNLKLNGLEAFKLVHYAGEVIYAVAGMVDKNADNLWRDLYNAMGNSRMQLLREIFPEIAESRQRPPTSGAVFKASMQSLVETLKQCEPHYIR
jgi:myosin-1